ncbi:CD151 antigen [Eurytemora carolleeae]|uniref:CD151 antigen n=1 Tax=Eurytemora carolleeae TaxID=1294199 RepID=UPI000C781D10|nr:CD151 antigen [Eurytemora carolleeae]|eukprot:XP_023347005.1 CD151 antigen-like [Eurytemora affinis]
MRFKISKCLVITISLGIKLIGILSLLCGTWILFSPTVSLYLSLLPLPALLWTTIFLQLGVYLVLTGVLGLVSAIGESRCYTSLYMILLCILLLAESIFSITILIYQINLIYLAKDTLQNRLYREYGTLESFSRAVDHLQFKFSCCGVVSSSDYNISDWRISQELNFPFTCCQLINRESQQAWERPQPENIYACQNELDSRENRHTQGCVLQVVEYVYSFLHSILLPFLLFISVQVAGVIGGFSICRRIDRQQYLDKFNNL